MISSFSSWTSPIEVPSHSTLICKVFRGTFRSRVDSSVTSHGFTAADLRMFVDEIKKGTYRSMALLDAVRGEVATLMHGQLFSFDCY